METLRVEIPDDTIAIERNRSPVAMQRDDFLWCLGAMFYIGNGAVVLDAPLFGFLHKIIRALKSRVGLGESILLEDEDQSYRLQVRFVADKIDIWEAYSGSRAVVPKSDFCKSMQDEFFRATDRLESALPTLLQNGHYSSFKLELRIGIQSLQSSLGEQR